MSVGLQARREAFVATVPTLDSEQSGRLNGGRIEHLQLFEQQNRTLDLDD